MVWEARAAAWHRFRCLNLRSTVETSVTRVLLIACYPSVLLIIVALVLLVPMVRMEEGEAVGRLDNITVY